MITTPYDKILKKRIRIAVTVLALTAIYLFAGMYWLVMTGFGWMLHVFFRDAYYAFFCKKRGLTVAEEKELNKLREEFTEWEYHNNPVNIKTLAYHAYEDKHLLSDDDIRHY
ncbi:MAG: hypothetical protein KF908_10395 [Nitrosomonas sp.]|uniref:Uncharacterized protein n=1 Tax=Nitrosomonas aestuarii TaxID=52441 RepID=A0A1I4DJC8_9PROT|nr:hypothetical protein [Nitrosomonas aestuarii]MBX3630293.1 hypothetical protein [Nitrosomonas sp.]SFK93754.1 hypothetical protein SAMN05216302_102189 [Nitrosomonas aestuarii]